GTKEIVAPPAPAFWIASSATGLLASASKPSGTSPASARRGLTNRPERTRVGSTSGGGATSPKGGTGARVTGRRASWRPVAAPRSTLPRATATNSAEPAIREGAAIDQPSGFGPSAACSCQHGCTSFITLETLPATPEPHAVVPRRHRAFLGPSPLAPASPPPPRTHPPP